MRVAFAFLLALSASGCNLFGPSTSVDGEWLAQLGKFSFVCMTLQQNGDGTYGSGDIRFLRDDRNLCGTARVVP